MYFKYPIIESTRLIKDCTWGPVRKSLMKIINDLEKKGPSAELETAKRRYLPLTIDDVQIEPVRVWSDGTHRVCISSRKTGFARGDVVIEPLPIHELLLELGWELKTVANLTVAKKLTRLNHPVNNLFYLEEEKEYLSFVRADFLKPERNLSLSTWLGNVFFRDCAIETSTTEENKVTVAFNDPAVLPEKNKLTVLVGENSGTLQELFGGVNLHLPQDIEQHESKSSFPMMARIYCDKLDVPDDLYGLKYVGSYNSDGSNDQNNVRFGDVVDIRRSENATIISIQFGYYEHYPIRTPNNIVQTNTYARFEYKDLEGETCYVDVKMTIPKATGSYPVRYGRFEVVDKGQGTESGSYLISIFDTFQNRTITGKYGERIKRAAVNDVPAIATYIGDGVYSILPLEPVEGGMLLEIVYGDHPDTNQIVFSAMGNINIDWTQVTLQAMRSKELFGFGKMGLNFGWGLGVFIGTSPLSLNNLKFEIISQTWEGWDFNTPPEWKLDVIDYPVISPSADWNTPFKGDPFKLSVTPVIRIWPDPDKSEFIDLTGTFDLWSGSYRGGISKIDLNELVLQRAPDGRYLSVTPLNFLESKVIDNPTLYKMIDEYSFEFPPSSEYQSYLQQVEFFGYVAKPIDDTEPNLKTGSYNLINAPVFAPAKIVIGSPKSDQNGNFEFVMKGIDVGVVIPYVTPIVNVVKAINSIGKGYEKGELNELSSITSGTNWRSAVTPKTISGPDDDHPIVKIIVELSYPAIGVFETKVIA